MDSKRFPADVLEKWHSIGLHKIVQLLLKPGGYFPLKPLNVNGKTRSMPVSTMSSSINAN